MSLSVREITDQAAWESFILKQDPTSFLQSWAWGEMQKNLRSDIFRLGLYEDKTLVGLGLVTKIMARRGTFLHCAYGPLLNWQKPNQFAVFADYLKSIARQQKIDFIRMNPLLENTSEYQQLFKELRFSDAPVHMMNPETSWLLDITKPEDELLKNMRKTTRYLIRKAEKDGVTIRQGTSEANLKTFYDIHLDTVTRQKFIPYSHDFLKAEMEVFSKNNQIQIFSADYQGRTIAAAIIVFYGQEAAYHHAASLSEYNKIPASYLLQWEVIKEAKRRDLKIYNFWGIVENKPRHPWAGLSLFKMGFGGYKKEYLHVQDLPLTGKYWLTWGVERLRKIKRGY